MNTIPKMRTIKQCHEELKKLDPETAVSEWFIRTLCTSNKVKHFLSGTKILVNYDDLLLYLNFLPPSTLDYNNITKCHNSVNTSLCE